MSIRDALLLIIGIGALPLCFLKPWFGVLMWSWFGFMNPHKLVWGIAGSLPFAQMVAIATLAGLIFMRERIRFPWTREVVLLSLLWLWFLCTTIFAEYQNDAWEFLGKVSKIFLMIFVTIAVIKDQQRFRWLLYVTALSIGYYGFKGGIWAVLTGAQEKVLGPEGTFIEGNTEIGLAMTMVLPMLFYLRRDEPRPWLRHLLLAVFGFSIIAILSTYSRGAFVALVAVLGMFFVNSRYKIPALLSAIVVISLALTAMPEKWSERMETIDPDKKESSAMQRVDSWKMAWNLALDRPFLGAGFRCFTPEMYSIYHPETLNNRVDAHSIIFQVLAEHGFTGIILYVSLLGVTFLRLRRMIRTTKRDPSRQWVFHYALMLETSLVGFFVGGLFLSRSYFDLYYALIASTVILHRLNVEAQSVSENDVFTIPIGSKGNAQHSPVAHLSRSLRVL